MTNLFLIVIFILLNRETIFKVQTHLLIYSNILIFIFNMLPIYPLDGGRIIKNVTHIFFGKMKSLKITNLISNIFLIILLIVTIYICCITKNIVYMFMIIYIYTLIIKENKKYKLKMKIYKYLNMSKNS